MSEDILFYKKKLWELCFKSSCGHVIFSNSMGREGAGHLDM